MATLLLGAVGAAAGGAVGGAAGARFGFAIGVTLAGVLFPPKLKPQERGKLDDLRLTASQYGAAIPMVFGCGRVGGTVIWATDLEERVSKKKVGGKGAPSTTVKDYSYFANLAVLVCEGPVGRIRRIWAEDRLLMDPDGLSGPAIAQPDWITIYTGEEAQDPDPLIESFKGVGNVPAYRGYCYIVFEDMPLAPYGNRLPSLEFEVCPLPAVDALLAYRFTSGAFLENTGSLAGHDLTDDSLCELAAQAIADGAVAVYIFDESSGNLINVANPGTHDQSVHANVTRGALGVVQPDALAYDMNPASAVDALFGHIEGTRPNCGFEDFTCEFVGRFPSPQGTTRFGIHFLRSGGLTSASMQQATNGSLNTAVLTTGNPNNSQVIAVGLDGEHSVNAHYVWRWDGQIHSGYRNAVQKYSVSVGGGGAALSDAAAHQLAIGGVFGSGASNIDGFFDFIAIYPNVHLTEEQIERHFNAAGAG